MADNSRAIVDMVDAAFVVQIHGGAWDIPQDLRSPHREGVIQAYKLCHQLLHAGKPALDVVVEALSVMEDNPVFDAGTGSFLNEAGEVEMDAAVMEGRDLRAGAVACLRNFANPSRIARAVMESTEHVMLVGQGAEIFASQKGFVPSDPTALVHPREVAAHKEWLRLGKPDAKVYFSQAASQSLAGSEPEKRGTVGVVIGVRQGASSRYHLFAGTSTGGTPGKRVGRVGDVPLVGCGLYADDWGAAVSCTGWGEGLTRIAAAKSVSVKVNGGMHPQMAVESILKELWERTGGRGGLIAIDSFGRTGAAYTTPDMAYAGPFCQELTMGL